MELNYILGRLFLTYDASEVFMLWRFYRLYIFLVIGENYD